MMGGVIPQPLDRLIAPNFKTNYFVALLETACRRLLGESIGRMDRLAYAPMPRAQVPFEDGNLGPLRHPKQGSSTLARIWVPVLSGPVNDRVYFLSHATSDEL